jgi:FkbM family methyltransferase
MSWFKKNTELWLRTALYAFYRVFNWSIYPGLKYADYRRVKRKSFNQAGVVNFGGYPTHYNDGGGFISNVKELFQEAPYFFKTENPNPRIIDCGAYIGLSVLYFKSIFPNARITAFEADPNIFETLRLNIDKRKLAGIEIINKAVWHEEKEMLFYGSNSMAGSLVTNYEQKGVVVTVPTTRLGTYLEEPVDLLKIDIEGAEFEVIKDVEQKLCNVKNIFIEYHSEPDKPQQLNLILGILSNAGFRYFIKDANLYTKQPFVNIHRDGFDLQLNIFGYRK